MDLNPTVILNDGHTMPLIGLGTLNFKSNDKNFNLNDFIMNAAKIGYTHFDVNPGNNQQNIGDALKLVFDAKRQLEDENGEKIPDQYEIVYPRDRMFVSYKVYNTPDIEKNLRNALKLMKLEYFDLVMMNCPTTPPPAPPAEGGEEGKGEGGDEEEDKPVSQRQSIKKGWKLLETCKEQGLCRSIGVANFTIQAILNLYPFVENKPTVNQIQCHPFLQQKNMVKLCRKLKIVPIAYCPLLRGGKDQKQPLGDKIDYMSETVLKQLAAKYAKTIPQMVLNYQICRGICVIPKTEKLDHLNDNFNITDCMLLEEDITVIETLDKEGKVKVYQLKNLPLWRGEDPLC